mgnify:CR=1 FL=1
MYSGITQGLFIVKLLIKRPGLFHYSVVLNEELAKNLKVGSSVSIDGVCQTVVAIHGYEVSFDAMQETLAKTTLNELFIGRKVSVERSIGFGDEIGGHELSGHIFETGIVIDKKINGENLCLSLQTSPACFAFIKPKGYLAVDGSSLTVGLTDNKQFSFENGHALYGYDGKCKNVQGHSYHLSVTVIGKPIVDRSNVKFGMVIDFTDLKKIVKEEIVDQFDHATVFNETTPHIELAKELKTRGHHVILVDYQPTSENMVIDFAQRIKNRLPEGIALFSLKLQETDSSFAEWFASDNL